MALEIITTAKQLTDRISKLYNFNLYKYQVTLWNLFSTPYLIGHGGPGYCLLLYWLLLGTFLSKNNIPYPIISLLWGI